MNQVDDWLILATVTQVIYDSWLYKPFRFLDTNFLGFPSGEGWRKQISRKVGFQMLVERIDYIPCIPFEMLQLEAGPLTSSWKPPLKFRGSSSTWKSETKTKEW